MTLQTLLDRFDLLMDTPESVPKLRQFILRLAVRGSLTDQKQTDTPAEVLLEQVYERKWDLHKEGEIRKPKEVDSVSGEEALHEIPGSWTWSRFNNVATIVSDRVDPQNHPDKPHVSPASVEKKSGKLLDYNTIGEDGVTSSKSRFQTGQIVYSKIRPNLAKAIIAEFEGLCSADMYPIRSHIETGYLHWYMLSEPFTAQVTVDDNRVAMPKTNQSELRRVVVPLPPLEEQQRIVETVDGLMDECDALEEQQEREHALQVQVGTAATEALQSADDAESLRPAWERVRGHFDTVTATPEGVDALRQTILQLAVQGRLTERDPDDVPAEVILEKLGSDVADESTRSHLPSLPEGWRWAALKNLLSNLRNGYSKAPRAESGTPVLRISAVRPLSVDLDDVRFLQERPDDFEKYLARPGDLLFIRYNGNKGLVGACAVVPSSVDKIGHPDKLIRGEVQRPDLTVPHYIAIALNCGKSRQHIDKKSKTTAGNYGISQTDLRSTPVPVPPAEEQARMVGVVNQLLPFCDDLESLLPEAQKCSGQLLETALNDVGLDRRDTVPS